MKIKINNFENVKKGFKKGFVTGLTSTINVGMAGVSGLITAGLTADVKEGLKTFTRLHVTYCCIDGVIKAVEENVTIEKDI